MIVGPASVEQVKEWRRIHKEYAPRLLPNKKSGAQVVEYLKSKYLLKEIKESRFLKIVSGNVLENDFWCNKLEGSQPHPICFFLENEGLGKEIYATREECWKDCSESPIFIGIDLTTGYIHIEGSTRLYDEIYAFQGVDKYDLANCVRVADYIECLEKYNAEVYKSL